MSALASAAQGGAQAEVDDSELVRRVRRGDERAFECLYHRYHRRITAYIQGMLHDHGRAEDVAQDVFVSALRRMRDTDRPIAFKPWIYEIAKNACIDQFRRSRRAEEVSYDADEGMGAADYGRLVSGDAMPETELESKQNLDHLRGAFGGLSETHHEILVMRELEGLSYREIGERLGMSRPSVESTLFRARRRLTEEYEELVSGQRCQRIQAIIAGSQSAAPGARDQRRLARHVSHCQPCRRQARLAGLEVPSQETPVRQRIAMLLPLPAFLRNRWLSGTTDASGLGTTQLSGVAQWSAQLGATMDPSWLKAAATAVTVAVAGAGAGLAGTPSGLGSSALGGYGSVLPALERSGGEVGSAHSARGGAGRPTVEGSAPGTAGAFPAAADRDGSASADPSAATASGDTGTATAVRAPDTSAVALEQARAGVGEGLEEATSGVGSPDPATASQGADVPAELPASSGIDLAGPQASQPAAAPAAPGLPVDPAAATDGAAGAVGSADGNLLGD